jgi:hypothetical protein
MKKFNSNRSRIELSFQCPTFTKVLLKHLIYAYTLSNEVHSVSIVHDAQQEKSIREKWNSIVPGLAIDCDQESISLGIHTFARLHQARADARIHRILSRL